MQYNPFLKKSATYIKNLIVFIAITLTIIALIVVSFLSILNIIILRDSLIKFIFAFLGFLLPIEKTAYERLKESSPWETYLDRAAA